MIKDYLKYIIHKVCKFMLSGNEDKITSMKFNDLDSMEVKVNDQNHHNISSIEAILSEKIL